jgi:two-component system secretion response regulator SsrB
MPFNPDRPQPKSIYLVDASETALQVVENFVAADSGWALLGHSPTVKDALLYAALTSADVYLVGLEFPDGSCLQVLEHLRRTSPNSARLVYLDGLVSLLNLASGAEGFALKGGSGMDLAAQLARALPKPRHSSDTSGLGGPLGYSKTANRGGEQEEDHLTARERQILLLLSQGHSQKVIADKVHISGHTVKQHIRSIYLKLDVHNVVQAINKAQQLGYLN